MKNQRKSSNSVRYLTRGATVAALYVALTFLVSLIGLDKGAIQFRLSEALCVLPAFMPEAVPGLFIGCILANSLTGCAPWDIVLGSAATLIGAVGARLLRRAPRGARWLIPFPTVMANALIVPLVIKYAYGTEGAYLFFFATVGIGEVVCAWMLGMMLYYYLARRSVMSVRNGRANEESV